MDNIKLWMLSLCGATAITAIFKILLSDTNLKKAINVFFSVFILFYILTPLNDYIKNDNSIINFYEHKTDKDEIYISGYEEIIKLSLENICNEKSIKVLDIKIESYLDDDGNIYINSLEIDIDDNNRILEIESVINEKLGYEVKVK